MARLPLELDRAGRTPLAVQIYGAIREAIVTRRLVPGAKLPSWRDLAIQLGISRGTVRVAYERLINEELAIGKGGQAPASLRAHPEARKHTCPPKRRFCPDYFFMVLALRPWHSRWECPLRIRSRLNFGHAS